MGSGKGKTRRAQSSSTISQRDESEQIGEWRQGKFYVARADVLADHERACPYCGGRVIIENEGPGWREAGVTDAVDRWNDYEGVCSRCNNTVSFDTDDDSDVIVWPDDPNWTQPPLNTPIPEGHAREDYQRGI